MKGEINLALADLRYTASADASGEDTVTVKSSDGLLEGTNSSTVSLVWPTGAATRPPTLSFRSTLLEMPEDGSIVLGPVDVRFGDGRSVVQGQVHCSAGVFELGQNDNDDRDEGVVVLEGGGDGDSLVLLGLARDVAMALSRVTYTPPKDWNSRVHGVVTLSMQVQAAEDSEVRVPRSFPQESPEAGSMSEYLGRQGYS